MSTVAFLGLGNMGGPMAANLVAAGHTVRGFDVAPALKAAAKHKGAIVFGSGAEAVSDADVVITAQRQRREGMLCRAPAGGQAGCLVHRYLDDLGGRCPQRQQEGDPTRVPADRRTSVRRCAGRCRRHPGIYDRR
jgi:NAD binding domain of 6-phosphogluconate dehydrogenase